MKDYVLEQRDDDPVLNFLIRLVTVRRSTQTLYVAGGLLQQPYFLMAYVEPWVKEALDEARKVNRLLPMELEGHANPLADAMALLGGAS